MGYASMETSRPVIDGEGKTSTEKVQGPSRVEPPEVGHNKIENGLLQKQKQTIVGSHYLRAQSCCDPVS